LFRQWRVRYHHPRVCICRHTHTLNAQKSTRLFLPLPSSKAEGRTPHPVENASQKTAFCMRSRKKPECITLITSCQIFVMTDSGQKWNSSRSLGSPFRCKARRCLHHWGLQLKSH
jgi:hypothetical protein